MNIHEYIQLFANIDKDNKAEQIKKSSKTLSSNKSQKIKNGYSHLPCQSDPKNSIRPTLLNDLGLNKPSPLKKHFKEFQQKYVQETAKKNSSKSDESYATASSVTEGSYVTAIEDVKSLKISTNDLECEISFDSSIDAGKRLLIRRLLQSKADGIDDKEECYPDCLSIQCETEDKYWNEYISEELMYEDRISRMFQKSTKDQNLHSLKQDIDINSKTQSDVPVQKHFPVRITSRQYFMSLTDEDFSEFERKESSESLSFRGNSRIGTQRNYSPSR